jgi:hypothetical protein
LFIKKLTRERVVPVRSSISSSLADAQAYRRGRLDGVQLQRAEYERAAKIFGQGDPATSVMYVEIGAVRGLVAHGKRALLDVGHFFGAEERLARVKRMLAQCRQESAALKAVAASKVVVIVVTPRPRWTRSTALSPCRPGGSVRKLFLRSPR